MYSETEDVIRALAENAEGVCRAYLPAGRREGSYWIVGDLQNNPGRSNSATSATANDTVRASASAPTRGSVRMAVTLTQGASAIRT